MQSRRRKRKEEVRRHVIKRPVHGVSTLPRHSSTPPGL
jgi:hypothetical protein